MTIHWDGNQWTHIPSPNPNPNPNYDLNVLLDVEAVSSDDVWAVGYTYHPGGGTLTLIEHWNGNQWSVVSSPNTNSVENYLYGVSVVSATDVWAVGYYVANIGGYGYARTLVEHWNGSQWGIVPSPNVGTYNNILYDISAISATDVWAVGYYEPGSGGSGTLIAHWNGSQWSVVPSPDPPNAYGTVLYGVAAISTNNAWAVGGYGSNAGVGGTVIEHWNGSQWSIVPSPNLSSHNTASHTTVNTSQLLDVSATSTNDVWAVGYHCCNDQGLTTVILRWEGSQWIRVPSPNPGINNNYLKAVSALSGEDVWTVGYFDLPGGPWQTLTEHYSDQCPPPAPTPTPTSTPQPMLVGHVNWQARPPQPDQLQQLPITLTLQIGTTEITVGSPPQLQTDHYGFFTVTVSTLPTGTYTWHVGDEASATHSPNYLLNSGFVQIGGDPITRVDMGLMRAGDANHDNRVSISDFNILKVAFASTCGDPTYDNRPDFTGDCYVNVSDFNPLKRNFGQQGAPLRR